MCDHKKLRKHFPFGRKSGCEIYCKVCGKNISKKELRDIKPKVRKRRYNGD